jgi:hypothetical protein
MRRLLVLFALALIGLGGVSGYPSLLFDSEPFTDDAYVMKLIWDEERDAILGEEVVTYTNVSQGLLQEIRFLADWRRETLEVQRVVDSEGADLLWEIEPLDWGDAGCVKTVRVQLPQPLEPGQRIHIGISFFLSPLTDEFEDAPFATPFSWYPRALSYDGEAWLLEKDRVASYGITLTIPRELVVASSGEEIDVISLPDGRKKVRLRAERVRGFGIFLADAVEIYETASRGVTIRSYFPDNFVWRGWGEKLATIAEDVIAFYVDEYGFYPQDYLHIIPGASRFPLPFPGGGWMPASNLIALHRGMLSRGVPWIVAHEIGHQYWWMYVMDSAQYPQWLSLGLTFYMDRQYMISKGLERRVYDEQRCQNYLAAVAMGYDTTVMRLPGTDSPSSGWLWNNAIAHSKGYAILNMLEHLVGEDVFRQVVVEILQRFGLQRLITNEDFISVCEEISGQALGWFFDQWLYTNKTLDYGIDAVSTEAGEADYRTTVRIRSVGEARMPVLVAATLRDGSIVTQVFDRQLTDGEVRFLTESPVQEVVLDPEGLLLDVSRSNNSHHVSGQTARWDLLLVFLTAVVVAAWGCLIRND